MKEKKVYALEMKGISKSFPGVKALDNVSLFVRKGAVHALMGENGAGKSTLMKILAGIYKPDSGELFLKGNKVGFANPREALHYGISMIHQELSFISELTVADNLFLGREPCLGKSKIINKKEQTVRALKLFSQYKIDLDPDKKMSVLSVSDRQMVEIVKAVSNNADIIVMDEPTSAITEIEVGKLFEIIKMLTSQGKSIIYISHKMNEIFKIADEITVLRDGCFIDSKPAAELNHDQLISLMVGRELKNVYQSKTANNKTVFMEVKNLSRKGSFENISFTLNKGEVIGIAGLVGAGRTEVVESIFGVSPPHSGEIYINQKKVVHKHPKQAINNGIALVTEDRKQTGLNLTGSVRDNITLVNLQKFSIFKNIISQKKENNVVDEQIQSLKIKTPNRNIAVKNLSGGNQQKIVIAKWLINNPDILILDEPTRGIDIGAKAEIYKIIADFASSGKSVIVISSEMPELFGICDRIIVMSEGKLTGEFTRKEFDQEKIMACCAGIMKGEKIG
ncbi:sugar ABC transporter ATP-binding protein [Neobacillus sp. MER 74]|uniref:sugar ABC transporter ATP-binding protein n=1 Tax=Neobacillus sp. MER 74 TaxID=2939566 RepID=UPI00203E724D|nr:sugar ABC transporter ATP-binding protein [Neobacillus sp. MER 74]MCM3114243.1 sugar ABC transporter ATP-binding protein [Neobacillus sp. MER 74]